MDWDSSALPKEMTRVVRPIGVLVALQNDAYLNVWPGSHKLATEKGVQGQNAGDVLLFDGALVHGGGAYTDTNFRLHKYLDVSSVVRNPDHTWIVDEDAVDEYKSCILDL